MNMTLGSTSLQTTSTRRTRAALALLPLAALASPLVTSSPAEAATDCTTDCVTVSATPSASSFTLRLSTDVPAKLSYRISSYTTGAQHAAGATAGVTSDGLQTVINAPQATAFRYDVYASDTVGHTWKETGYFSTLRRDVKVSLNSVSVSDDGDLFGPGEIVGATQVLSGSSTRCSMKALAPFSLTTPRSTSAGTTLAMGSVADQSCTKVPSSISVESALADNDVDAGDSCGAWWPWQWGSGTWRGKQGHNACADWNFQSRVISDPITYDGYVSMAVPFTVQSATSQTLSNVGPEWTLKGTASFLHTDAGFRLPATVGAPAVLEPTITPRVGGFTVDIPRPSMPGITPKVYWVRYKDPSGLVLGKSALVDPLATHTVISIDVAREAATYEIETKVVDTHNDRHLFGMRYIRTL